MAKKKKSQVTIPPFVKTVFAVFLVIGISVFAVDRTRHILISADFFKVRSVTIDPVLQFINKEDLRGLIGKNIFTVDLKSVERKLGYKYPQASQLKIARRFPDQISVVAKKRVPYAQLSTQSRTVTVDDEGVILSLKKKDDKKLPSIMGARLTDPELVLGLPLRSPDIWMSLKIIKLFSAHEELENYAISEINMENLSKIYFTLTNKLDVIIDGEDLDQDMRVLSVVLSKGKLNLSEIKYIDLRFNEPIIGKK